MFCVVNGSKTIDLSDTAMLKAERNACTAIRASLASLSCGTEILFQTGLTALFDRRDTKYMLDSDWLPVGKWDWIYGDSPQY